MLFSWRTRDTPRGPARFQLVFLFTSLFSRVPHHPKNAEEEGARGTHRGDWGRLTPRARSFFHRQDK